MPFRNKQDGVAALELSILLIPLILIAFGITEFGRAFYEYNTIAKATRNAARYLSRAEPGDVTAHGTARCLAVHGNEACTGPALAPGLETSMVHICDASVCPTTHSAGVIGGGMNLVTVTVGGDPTPYTFVSLVSFVVPDVSFGAISMTMHQTS